MATVTAAGFTHDAPQRPRGDRHDASEVDVDASAYEAGEHESFMRKEILEQPTTAQSGCCAAASTSASAPPTWAGSTWTPASCGPIRRVKILGCGSAYYVGQMGAALIEELARIPADAEAASEFRYRNPVIEPDTLYVAVSQSGETIDTLLAVQEITPQGRPRASAWSTSSGRPIARECDGGIYLHAGPEVAVASTKALTNMFLGFALLALQLGRVRDLSIADGQRLVAGLERLPGADRGGPRPARPSWSRSPNGPRRGARACSSSAGCAASRSPARARRSSRRSPTGTPRPTRPPSSSTARSP